MYNCWLWTTCLGFIEACLASLTGDPCLFVWYFILHCISYIDHHKKILHTYAIARTYRVYYKYFDCALSQNKLNIYIYITYLLLLLYILKYIGIF